MTQRMLLMAVVLWVSCAIGGCVSMGKYDLKEKEASDTVKNLQDLQQKYTDLTGENAGLKAEVEKLTGNVAVLTKDKENLTVDNKKLDNVLKAKSDELSKNISELRQKSADLENENARLKGDIANLQKAKVEEVQKTSKTYEEMLEKMKSEISQGQVTISELKGKLTVNMVDAILFDSGKAEVKLAVDYSGDNLSIAFNPNFLMDVLRVLSGDDVFMEMKDSTRPAVLREDGEYLYVVMPINIMGE